MEQRHRHRLKVALADSRLGHRQASSAKKGARLTAPPTMVIDKAGAVEMGF
jgi:hypothetical protein